MVIGGLNDSGQETLLELALDHKGDEDSSREGEHHQDDPDSPEKETDINPLGSLFFLYNHTLLCPSESLLSHVAQSVDTGILAKVLPMAN